jgi:hypothetical protein
MSDAVDLNTSAVVYLTDGKAVKQTNDEDKCNQFSLCLVI